MSNSNLRQLFDHFNKDKSGYLERDELKHMLRTLGKIDHSLNINEQTVEEWTRLADLNNDKKLSYYDFTNMLSKYLVPNDQVRANLRKQFYSYDMNANGLMDRREFENYMKGVYRYMNDSRFQFKENVANQFFDRIDRDGDGVISFDEYYLFTNGVLYATD